ncbi:MAG TPA: hypothetical protein VMW42_08615, partial [Desulfatiglandales bacterium]|nr:hypothetical protein [Desulfatiglandales bacterium]
MEFIRPNINIDFIGKRKIAFILSGVLILSSILLLVLRGGPNYGVDFSGGILVQVRFAHSTTTNEIRQALKSITLEGSI